MLWYDPPQSTSPRRNAAQYEFRVLTIPRDASRGELRRMLTEQAEYGRWELARSRLYVGGTRKIWLRRKVIRVRRTL